MDTLPSRMLIVIGLIILLTLLRCVELSSENIGESKLKKRADEGSKRAEKLLKLLKEPQHPKNCVLFAVTLSEIVLSAYSVLNIAPLWAFQNEFIKYLLTVIIVLGLIAVFALYLPGRLSAKYSEKILFSFAWLFFGVFYIFMPFVTVCAFLADGISLLFGVNPKEQNDEVTEEEIRYMVDEGSKTGAIDPEEKKMIHNIFELDDTPAEDIMTHRTDVEFLWLEDTDKWEEVIDESNHSIYPVCGESVDDIVGVLNSRDYLRALRRNEEISKENAKKILRQPYFVPESIKADDLFKKMQENKTHFALVLDEYGGLSGIITVSDLLEEIVGSFTANFDDETEEEILQVSEDTWKIKGAAEIEKVCEALNIDLPVDDCNTFAGMILGVLGSIPDDGTQAEVEAYGLHIEVTKIEEHRIEDTVVKVIDTSEKEENEE